MHCLSQFPLHPVLQLVEHAVPHELPQFPFVVFWQLVAH
nr:MAG TPA: hypothetical protein [Caudoviricetes sp.]